jgi:tetratricopeptide (TPR) repeat protein
MRTALCVLALATFAFAEQRGFAEGKFLDDYFGIAYEAPELTEGFSMGGPNVLFSGKAAGDVTVEIEAHESPADRTAAEWRAALEKSWEGDGKTRADLQRGEEPVPWITFVQESLAGFQRHHGFAFYVRGTQGFVVHAQVREKSDASGAAIQAALKGLSVKADAAPSFLLAHVVAKQQNGDPRSGMSLLLAGRQYVRSDAHAIGLRALEAALKNAPEGGFEADAAWELYFHLGLAQLTLKQREEAVPTWLKAIELAPKTQSPQDNESLCHYNLACAYALLGKLDEAFASLKRSAATGSAEHVANLKSHGQTDPDLESLRADPRWAAAFDKAEAPAPH